MNLRPLAKQLLDAVIVLYSLVVMASTIPSLRYLASVVLVPYYLLVPGYTLATLLSESPRVIGKAFNSVAWSLVIVASVSSIQSVAPGSQSLPLSIVVPFLTLALFTCSHFVGNRS